MTKRTVRFGVAIGSTGGGLMALFAMTAMKLLGKGFFTPVNLFAHTFWQGAPLGGTFTVASVELGLAIHFAISIVIGTLIAYLVERGQLDAGMIMLLGLGAGAAAWIIQSFAWTAINADAHAAFTPWVLAVAHVMFAVGSASFLVWMERRSRPATPAATLEVESKPTRPPLTPRPTRAGFSRTLGDGPNAGRREIV